MTKYLFKKGRKPTVELLETARDAWQKTLKTFYDESHSPAYERAAYEQHKNEVKLGVRLQRSAKVTRGRYQKDPSDINRAMYREHNKVYQKYLHYAHYHPNHITRQARGFAGDKAAMKPFNHPRARYDDAYFDYWE